MTRRNLSKSIRDRIAARDGSCVWCGCEGPYQIDHIKEVRAGGTDDDDNLRRLCVACHKVETARYARARSVARKHRPNVEGPTTIPDYGSAPKRKKIQGRGFDTRFKKKLDGSVERR